MTQLFTLSPILHPNFVLPLYISLNVFVFFSYLVPNVIRFASYSPSTGLTLMHCMLVLKT